MDWKIGKCCKICSFCCFCFWFLSVSKSKLPPEVVAKKQLVWPSEEVPAKAVRWAQFSSEAVPAGIGCCWVVTKTPLWWPWLNTTTSRSFLTVRNTFRKCCRRPNNSQSRLLVCSHENESFSFSNPSPDIGELLVHYLWWRILSYVTIHMLEFMV